MSQRVAIAVDHGGFGLKSVLVSELGAQGRDVLDLGTWSSDPVDYPDFAASLVSAVADGEAEMGVLVCGTGIGMAIAANRHAFIRAALCHDATTARLARQHNDANVLVLGARVVGPETARDCLKTFLATAFDGERHARRVGKLSPQQG